MAESRWAKWALGDLSVNLDARRKPVKEADRHPGPYPYYGASGVVDYVDNYLFEGEHLLIAEDGENLRTRKLPIAFLASGRFWVNNHAHIIVGNERADTRFLLYAIQIADVKSYLSGSTMPKLTQGNLKRIPISAPGLEEQRSIVALLSALDDKIELNRRMNETLEAQARALFRDWFVDFGPVKAKMGGAAAYLAPDLWSLFPDRLDDNGVPEGWTLTPLSEQFVIIGGGTPKTSVPEYWGGSIPWFSVVDSPAASDVFVFDTDKTLTADGVKNSSVRLVRPGTTIISARGTVGNLAMAAQEMTFNQSCYALQGRDGASDPFVYLAATHMVDRLQSMAHGSVFSTITRNTFEGLSLPRPTRSVHKGFNDLASAIFDKIRSNGQENRTLAQTRDLLLPKLMSGEIRVGDIAAAGELA